MGKLKVYGTWAAVRATSRLTNLNRAVQKAILPPIYDHRAGEGSRVEEYWTSHTVMKSQFASRWESDRYFQLLCKMYPLFDQTMEFSVQRHNASVLDYGCGTGNEVYRLLVQSKARSVTAVDISPTAIQCARERIRLYPEAHKRVEFHLVSDRATDLPFESDSFDYINCVGVLMHASHPHEILKEFFRVLRPGGHSLVMVYVQPSIFFNFYIPYYWQRLRGRWPGLDTEEAFQRGTDGEGCPISRCYKIADFALIAKSAGFNVDYKGGYFDQNELWLVKKYLDLAKNDEGLVPRHREVLSALTLDQNGYPMLDGRWAGVSGVFRLSKP